VGHAAPPVCESLVLVESSLFDAFATRRPDSDPSVLPIPEGLASNKLALCGIYWIGGPKHEVVKLLSVLVEELGLILEGAGIERHGDDTGTPRPFSL
jgi:hypothetical protein